MPVRTETSSRISSCRAFCSVTAVDIWVSSTLSCNGRPSNPPAALISSTTNCAQLRLVSPTRVSGPLSGASKPILSGVVARTNDGIADVVSAPRALNKVVRVKARRFIMFFIGWKSGWNALNVVTRLKTWQTRRPATGIAPTDEPPRHRFAARRGRYGQVARS